MTEIKDTSTVAPDIDWTKEWDDDFEEMGRIPEYDPREYDYDPSKMTYEPVW